MVSLYREAIRHINTIKKSNQMIPVYKPYLTQESLKYAHQALDSTWISSIGEYKDKATEKLKEITKAKNVLLVNNGTSAMHLVAKALKRTYPEVKTIIVPNGVYVAAWNCLLYDNYNWDIRVVDMDIDSWNIDINKIGYYDYNTTAILAVHNLGNIININELKRKFKVVIEDNCEGFGGAYNGVHSGTSSFCSGMSFFGNKNITCGEGGAIYCNDDETYSYLVNIHGQGQSAKRYVHGNLGYNYRMTNIQAAILYGQLNEYNKISELKCDLFDSYYDTFRQKKNIRLQKVFSECSHSNWMFGLRVLNGDFQKAESFFNDAKIEIRPMFYPFTAHSHLSLVHDYLDETNTRLINKEAFIIPSYPSLQENEIEYIKSKVIEYSNLI